MAELMMSRGTMGFLKRNISNKALQLSTKFQSPFQLTDSMGKKIENYVLDNIIGEGEFGKVYKAVNEKTSQTVAIKIIKIEKFKMSPKLQEFTINEIQTLSKIEDTTHVVRFIEILKTANNYYFVYEYCNGGTLEQEIKGEGRFTEEKALNYFKDLLKAFQILIKSNVMHRDIKPSNILLNNGIIKLADFGFCKPLKDARDLSQTMLGSPIYMAPQILKGEAYTIKTDIWSLGVVLYQMIYGFCPFEEKTIARLISLIDETTVLFPSNVKISKKTEQLIKRMLVKDQFRRITWQQLFSFDLSLSMDEEKFRPVSNNAFSKKGTFTSIITEEVKNRYLSPTENSFKSESSKQNLMPVSTNNSNNIPYNVDMRKKEPKSFISQSDKKIVQTCLDNRNKINQGIKLLKSLLHDNSTKLSISICCFLAKKIRSFNRENIETLKKISADKENKDKNCELRKLLSILNEQKGKVEEKLAPFESEYDQIKEPQEIIFLKFAEEEGLTQERQGLLQLVQIYDYLNVEGRSTDYNRLTKKELLEEYEKRILKKA